MFSRENEDLNNKGLQSPRQSTQIPNITAEQCRHYTESTNLVLRRTNKTRQLQEITVTETESKQKGVVPGN